MPGQYVRRSIPRRYASDCIEKLQGYVMDVWLYVCMYVLGVCLTERKRERERESVDLIFRGREKNHLIFQQQMVK